MDPSGEESSTPPPTPTRRRWRRFRGGLAGRHKHPLRAGLALAALLLAGVGGALAVAANSKAACAGSADAVLSRTLGEVGMRIYRGELSRTGAGARAIASVTHSNALARAVASGEPMATRAAVMSIVYNHLHIVRLRAIRNGRVLADVGGPFVLAPLGGDIRLRGRTVGRYVLSIQDDLGYVLLSGRLGDMQVVMRAGGRQIMSSLQTAPVSLPAQGTTTVGGVTYVTHEINATAFPSGPLADLPVGAPALPFAHLLADQDDHFGQRREARRAAVRPLPSHLPGLYLGDARSERRGGAHPCRGKAAREQHSLRSKARSRQGHSELSGAPLRGVLLPLAHRHGAPPQDLPAHAFGVGPRLAPSIAMSAHAQPRWRSRS
jgi:hypothetical protein